MKQKCFDRLGIFMEIKARLNGILKKKCIFTEIQFQIPWLFDKLGRFHKLTKICQLYFGSDIGLVAP